MNKSVKETGRKYGKSQSVQKSAKLDHLTFKVRGLYTVKNASGLNFDTLFLTTVYMFLGIIDLSFIYIFNTNVKYEVNFMETLGKAIYFLSLFILQYGRDLYSIYLR